MATVPQAADRRHRQYGGDRPEGKPRHDAAVEGIGGHRRRWLMHAFARIEQRQHDQQRRDQEEELADGELQRMPEVVVPAARQHRAVLGIGEGQEVVAPSQTRCGAMTASATRMAI